MPRESPSQNRPERGIGNFRVPKVQSQVFGLPGGPSQTTAEIAGILQAGVQLGSQLQQNKKDAEVTRRRKEQEARVQEYQEEQKEAKSKREEEAILRAHNRDVSNKIAKIQLRMSGGDLLDVAQGVDELRAMQLAEEEAGYENTTLFVSAIAGGENKVTGKESQAEAEITKDRQDAMSALRNELTGADAERSAEILREMRALEEGAGGEDPSVFTGGLAAAENRVGQLRTHAQALTDKAEAEALAGVHGFWKGWTRGQNDEVITEAYLDSVKESMIPQPVEVDRDRFSESPVPEGATEPAGPPPTINDFLRAGVEVKMAGVEGYADEDGNLNKFGRDIVNKVMIADYMTGLHNEIEDRVDTLRTQGRNAMLANSPQETATAYLLDVILNPHKSWGELFNTVSIATQGDHDSSRTAAFRDKAIETLVLVQNSGKLSATTELLMAFRDDFPTLFNQVYDGLVQKVAKGDKQEFWDSLIDRDLNVIVAEVTKHIEGKFNFFGKIYATMSDEDYVSLLETTGLMVKDHFTNAGDRVFISSEFEGLNLKERSFEAAKTRIISLLEKVTRDGQAHRNKLALNERGTQWVTWTNENLTHSAEDAIARQAAVAGGLSPDVPSVADTDAKMHRTSIGAVPMEEVKIGLAQMVWNKNMPALLETARTNPNLGAFAAIQMAEFIRMTKSQLPPELISQLSTMINSNDTNQMVLAAQMSRELRVNAPEAHRAAFGSSGSEDEITRNRLALADWEVHNSLSHDVLDAEGRGLFVDLAPLIGSIKDGSTLFPKVGDSQEYVGSIYATARNWEVESGAKLAAAAYVDVLQSVFPNFEFGDDVKRNLFEPNDSALETGELNHAQSFMNKLYRGQEWAQSETFLRASYYQKRNPNLSMEQSLAMSIHEDVSQNGLRLINTQDGPTAVYDPKQFLGASEDHADILMHVALPDVLAAVKLDKEGTMRSVATDDGREVPQTYRMNVESVFDDTSQWALEIDVQGHHQSNARQQGGLPVVLVHRPEPGVVIRYRVRFKDDTSYFLNIADYGVEVTGPEAAADLKLRRRHAALDPDRRFLGGKPETELLPRLLERFFIPSRSER